MRADLRSLLEFRRIIEPHAALRCARYATAEDLDRLQAIVDELEGAIDAPMAENLQIDIRFHFAVGQIGHNDVVARTLQSTLDEIILMRSFFPFGHLQRHNAVQIQQDYLDGLRTRDPRVIAATVSEHLSAFEDVILGMALEPAFLPAVDPDAPGSDGAG
jgi:DNA-binding GntR family transcriptional regulator